MKTRVTDVYNTWADVKSFAIHENKARDNLT